MDPVSQGEMQEVNMILEDLGHPPMNTPMESPANQEILEAMEVQLEAQAEVIEAAYKSAQSGERVYL